MFLIEALSRSVLCIFFEILFQNKYDPLAQSIIFKGVSWVINMMLSLAFVTAYSLRLDEVRTSGNYEASPCSDYISEIYHYQYLYGFYFLIISSVCYVIVQIYAMLKLQLTIKIQIQSLFTTNVYETERRASMANTQNIKKLNIQKHAKTSSESSSEGYIINNERSQR